MTHTLVRRPAGRSLCATGIILAAVAARGHAAHAETVAPGSQSATANALQQAKDRVANAQKAFDDAKTELANAKQAEAALTGTQSAAASPTSPASTTDKPSTDSTKQALGFSHCEAVQVKDFKGTLLLEIPYMILQHAQFGSDGPSTIASDCDVKSHSQPNGSLLGDTPATLGGAQVSYSFDGVQRKLAINYVGAFGYTLTYDKSENAMRGGGGLFPADAIFGDLSVYGRVDHESQRVTVITNHVASYQSVYSQNVIEFGLAYRSHPRCYSTGLPAPPPPANKDQIAQCGAYRDGTSEKWNWSKLPVYFYLQPLYLADNLRDSTSVALNTRVVPLLPMLNQFNEPVSSYVSEHPNFNAHFYYGFILEPHLDLAHFTNAGAPLASPTSKVSATGAQPLYLPNEDYARVGGHIGAFGQVVFGGADATTFGMQPLNISVYYADYTALAGVRHDFGEMVGQLSYPIISNISASLSYTNGRTENVAARVETWGFSIKLGGQSH